MSALQKTEIIYSHSGEMIYTELVAIKKNQKFFDYNSGIVWMVKRINTLGATPSDVLVTFSDVSSTSEQYTYTMEYIRKRLRFGDKEIELVV